MTVIISYDTGMAQVKCRLNKKPIAVMTKKILSSWKNLFLKRNISFQFFYQVAFPPRQNKRTNERMLMNEWTNEQMNEQMNERMNERTNERTNKQTNKQTNKRTNECKWMKSESRIFFAPSLILKSKSEFKMKK